MAADTRGRILEAALASFVDDGYEHTTTALIRKRSGVSNGALFHHFRSKEAIADALHVHGIASFQDGLWEIVRTKPRGVREAVGAVIEHQLAWTEENPELARFLYMRGHLDWSPEAASQLEALNRELADAFQAWLAPLAERGEMRRVSRLMLTAIVSGPVHAIAQRWLAGQVKKPLRSYAGELTDAACAALRAKPGPERSVLASAPPAAQQGRLTVQLVADDGSVVAEGEATAELAPVRAVEP